MKVLVIVLAVLYVLVMGVPFATDGGYPPPVPGPDVCLDRHYVIQIHGTMSTGEFQPSDFVKNLDPANPDPRIFDAERNDEFRRLIHVHAACVLTFSYDDIYLARNGTSTPGVYAWNKITSPWARKPDELAKNLWRLMDAPAYHGATFDIVAYSAGGIVPVYWAARDGTSDTERARVRSIDVLDGVVSGADWDWFDWACAHLPNALRLAPVLDLGPVPCQFRRQGEFIPAVRTSNWYTKTSFSTERADGDRIVLYDVAGLPGKTVFDPDLQAVGCAWWQFAWYGIPRCIFKTHGSVLKDLDLARDTIGQTIGLHP